MLFPIPDLMSLVPIFRVIGFVVLFNVLLVIFLGANHFFWNKVDAKNAIAAQKAKDEELWHNYERIYRDFT